MQNKGQTSHAQEAKKKARIQSYKTTMQAKYIEVEPPL